MIQNYKSKNLIKSSMSAYNTPILMYSINSKASY
jgi:hypothetical protein